MVAAVTPCLAAAVRRGDLLTFDEFVVRGLGKGRRDPSPEDRR
jgi:hypothetical protein